MFLSLYLFSLLCYCHSLYSLLVLYYYKPILMNLLFLLFYIKPLCVKHCSGFGREVQSTELKLWCFWSEECGLVPILGLVSLSKITITALSWKIFKETNSIDCVPKDWLFFVHIDLLLCFYRCICFNYCVSDSSLLSLLVFFSYDYFLSNF